MPFDHVQFDTYTKKLGKAQKGVKDLKKRYLENIAKDFLDKAKEVTPYVTGNLYDGWYISDTKLGTYHSEVHVNNDAVNKAGKYYGSYVEDGYTHWVSGDWIEGQHMSQIAAGYINMKARHRWTDTYRYWLKKNGLY